MQRITQVTGNTARLMQKHHGSCFHTSSLLKSSSLESEYLHISRIPTYHFQKSLPRLAVPDLEKSCQRYLKAQLPLLSTEEHKEVQSLVTDFQANHGPQLQKDLVETDKQNKHTNYVSDLWFDMYLKDRRPILLTHNPFISFTPDPNPEYNSQLIRSTNMLISATRFMKTLRDEKLEPEVFHLNPAKSDTSSFRTFTRLLPQSLSWYGAYLYKAFPLDMSQFGNLFNSTRIPLPERDGFYTNKEAKNIVVMRNGNFYSFDMLDGDGNLIPAEEVLAHLTYITNDTTPAPEYPISTLTSEFRDVWTKARVQLINADPQNEERLRIIDGALFVICFDDVEPNDPDEVSKQFLFGDGINRWYDKSFQLLFSKGQHAAVHFEHAWGDGVAVLRFFKEVYADSTKKPQVHPDTRPAQNANSGDKVQRLEFTLDAGLKETIQKAKKRFDDVTSSLQAGHLQYQKLTKTDAKKAKLSPDSFVQLAIQLGHYRMYGKNVGTYESCSTSAFKHGRTETVRSCTTATDAMCQMLYGKRRGSASVEELMEGLRECTVTHNQLTKDAAMGQGFDRHLFFLRHLAEQQGLSLPIFTHPSYAKLNHIVLSTSTLSDPSVVIGGFAAVTPDGYGIGYGVFDDYLGFNVTSYPACNVNDFIDACAKSLDDLHDILHGRKPESLS